MRVLIAEDDRDALDLLDNALQYFGYEVTRATNGREALEALRPGVRVRHDEYGPGLIRRISGRGMSARAAVRFDDGVEREFVLEYAGLKLLEDMQW